MIARLAICFTALLALPTVVDAQSCSGGITGGMDATGNECNVSTSEASYASHAPAPPHSSPKAETLVRVDHAARGTRVPASNVHLASTGSEQHRAEATRRASGQRKAVAEQAKP